MSLSAAPSATGCGCAPPNRSIWSGWAYKALRQAENQPLQLGQARLAESSVYGQEAAPYGAARSPAPRKFPMPKVPDMSAAAVKTREAMTKLAKANKPKEAPPAPPKPRVAK